MTLLPEVHQGANVIDLVPSSIELVDKIHKSTFVPADLRGHGNDILACILSGAELGLGPMQALQKIHVVKGKPVMSAELMRALVRREGHKIRVQEASAEKCVVTGIRRDDPEFEQRSEFTIDDAKRAGLVKQGSGWDKYPKAMLEARATSQLCRSLFPDVLAGISYTPEDFDIIDVEPAHPVTRMTHLGALPTQDRVSTGARTISTSPAPDEGGVLPSRPDTAAGGTPPPPTGDDE